MPGQFVPPTFADSYYGRVRTITMQPEVEYRPPTPGTASSFTLPSVSWQWDTPISEKQFSDLREASGLSSVRCGLNNFDPAGHTLGEMRVLFRRRLAGEVRVHLSGLDRSETVEVTLTATQDLLQVRLAFRAPRTVEPLRLLPALRFMRHLSAPNTTTLTMAGTPIHLGQTLSQSPQVSVANVDIVRSLALIQSRTGHAFEVPASLTAEEVTKIRDAEALLEGQRVNREWQHARITFADDEDWAGYLDQPGQFRLEVPVMLSVSFGEVEVELGEGEIRFEAAVPVKNQAPPSARAGGAGHHADFKPGTDDRCVLHLVDPPARALDEPGLSKPVELPAIPSSENG